MTAIIFHRIDWDGYTSAAVALRAFPDADLIGWNYGDPYPDVSGYDRVVLVDLTIHLVNPDRSKDLSWMMENQSKLIWIDHHPIISEVPGEYAGIQQEGIGACYLTWKYFHVNYGLSCNMDHIRMAATYDVFRKDGLLCSWEDAWAYQLYLNSFGPGYKNDCDQSKKLVDMAGFLIEWQDISSQLKEGYSLEASRAKREEEVFQKHAMKVEIDGSKGWIIETNEQPSLIIKDHSDSGDGDFFLVFSLDKKNENGDYIMSMRVPDHSNFNAQKFAKAHGGGGHPKACGGIKISDDELSAICYCDNYEYE